MTPLSDLRYRSCRTLRGGTERFDRAGPATSPVRRHDGCGAAQMPQGAPVTYQSMKNAVHATASARKYGIINAMTVPIPERLS